MKIVLEKGHDELATVYAAVYRNDDRFILEFVDSLSGSRGIDEKWVVVVSSQFGCAVGCMMCDTKDYFMGDPTTEELLSQVDHVVRKRFPDGRVPTAKFKVQFARMGEPAFNMNVLEAVRLIPERFDAPGYMPCISTVAPYGKDGFFSELMELNHGSFHGGFQLQFSVHSTNEKQRDRIIPVKKWDLHEIADYGNHFYTGGRKVTLNFALGPQNEFDPGKISELFSPEVFMIKLTPVNPTRQAIMNKLVRERLFEDDVPQLFALRDLGFEVVLSNGDPRENDIGSNCGQLAALWKKGHSFMPANSLGAPS
ncbi:MAG: radical SAM protein [Candidatus Thermoplasmatota archaeon]|nr:radical SAM protein [Candidatus Thermoplasmatota archaeon]